MTLQLSPLPGHSLPCKGSLGGLSTQKAVLTLNRSKSSANLRKLLGDGGGELGRGLRGCLKLPCPWVPLGEPSLSFSPKAQEELLHLPLELIVGFHGVTPHGQTQYYRQRKRAEGREGVLTSLAG